MKSFAISRTIRKLYLESERKKKFLFLKRKLFENEENGALYLKRSSFNGISLRMS